MATKEQQQKVLALLNTLLKKGADWDKLTIKGITIQKLPERTNKAGTKVLYPPSLAVVFNPTIDNVKARKGKYIRSKNYLLKYYSALTDDLELMTKVLAYTDKLNPKTSAVKSDVSDVELDFDL